MKSKETQAKHQGKPRKNNENQGKTKENQAKHQ